MVRKRMYVGRVIGNIEIEIFIILCFNIIYAKLFDYLPCHFFGGKNNLTAVRNRSFPINKIFETRSEQQIRTFWNGRDTANFSSTNRRN